jgi:hypothetical protein
MCQGSESLPSYFTELRALVSPFGSHIGDRDAKAKLGLLVLYVLLDASTVLTGFTVTMGNLPINQLISQSINQSVNQSISQSVNQLINQSIKINQSTNNNQCTICFQWL